MVKIKIFSKFLLIFALLFVACNSFAWQRNISLGYGIGPDTNNAKVTNSGFFASSDFLTMYLSDQFRWTLGGSLGQWHTSAPIHKDVTTAALFLGLRAYLKMPVSFAPYFLASFGPGYLSETHFGLNDQGSNFAFQTVLGLGTEFGQNHNFDLNIKWVHYSNAYLFKPNEGYNILYVVSLGYLF